MDSRSLRVFQDNYVNGPAMLIQSLDRVPQPARKWRPRDDAWSVHEIICHCADSETYATTRLRLLLTTDDPLIVGYDLDHWARALAYHGLALNPTIDAIRAVRANTVALARSLRLESLSVSGRYTESGPYSVEDWIRRYGEYLQLHAAQVDDNHRRWIDAGKPAVDEG